MAVTVSPSEMVKDSAGDTAAIMPLNNRARFEFLENLYIARYYAIFSLLYVRKLLQAADFHIK